jgi:hypothetical protein
MSNYADLIYLMGAMLVFSLLTIQTNRMFHIYNRIQVNSEVEYHAISVAQEIVDKIQWMKEQEFNSYKNTFPKEVPVVFDEETLYFNVDLTTAPVENPTLDADGNVQNTKITLTVTNEYLKTTNGDRFIKFEFMKSFSS